MIHHRRRLAPDRHGARERRSFQLHPRSRRRRGPARGLRGGRCHGRRGRRLRHRQARRSPGPRRQQGRLRRGDRKRRELTWVPAHGSPTPPASHLGRRFRRHSGPIGVTTTSTTRYAMYAASATVRLTETQNATSLRTRRLEPTPSAAPPRGADATGTLAAECLPLTSLPPQRPSSRPSFPRLRVPAPTTLTQSGPPPASCTKPNSAQSAGRERVRHVTIGSRCHLPAAGQRLTRRRETRLRAMPPTNSLTYQARREASPWGITVTTALVCATVAVPVGMPGKPGGYVLAASLASPR